MNSDTPFTFMRLAIRLADENVQKNMAPFAAIIVLDNKIIGTGTSMVRFHTDPTSHAEINAIRNACMNIGQYRLHGSTIYTTAEPCPMCLGAILWAGIDKIYYGNSVSDTDHIGYRDKIFFEQYRLPSNQRKVPAIQILSDEAIITFNTWKKRKELCLKKYN